MKTAVLFSGGIDSIVLANLIYRSGKLGPLYLFNYGQASYKQQLAISQRHASLLGTSVVVLTHDYLDIIQSGNPSDVTNLGAFEFGYVPKTNQYRDELSADAEVSDADSGLWTWLNGRNALFLLQASIHASYRACDKLAYGLQLNTSDMDENTQLHPRRGNDTNIQLVNSMNALIHQSFQKPFLITTPLLGFTKDQVVELGKSFQVDFSDSYSCEFYPACGKCAQCTDSTAALRRAGYLTDTK